MTAQQICDVLNQAFEADSSAMHMLNCLRVPCNDAMAKHPTIQVRETSADDLCAHTVSFLGLLNAMTAMDGEIIEALYDQDDDWSPWVLIGYRLRAKEPAVAEPVCTCGALKDPASCGHSPKCPRAGMD